MLLVRTVGTMILAVFCLPNQHLLSYHHRRYEFATRGHAANHGHSGMAKQGHAGHEAPFVNAIIRVGGHDGTGKRERWSQWAAERVQTCGAGDKAKEVAGRSPN
jgi:hypothetical protein